MSLEVHYFKVKGKLYGYVPALGIYLSGETIERIRKAALEAYKDELKKGSISRIHSSILRRKHTLEGM